MLHRHHPVEHRGDAEEGGDTLLLDHFERLLGLEVDQDQRTPVGHVVHRERYRDVVHLAGEHVDVAGHDALGDGLVEHPHGDALVRVESSLGLPGRPAGVEDQDRIVVTYVSGPDRLFRRGGRENHLVGSVAALSVLEPMGDIYGALEFALHVAKLLRADDRLRLAVREDPRQLRGAQPPV